MEVLAVVIFGVCRLDQLHRGRLQRRLGRRRFVAATLYSEVCNSDHPERDRLLELVLCQLTASNRTYKRTYAARFRQFDQAIVRLLADSARHRSLRVHDLAVSNGITAVDLYRTLCGQFADRIDFLASDLSTGVVAVRDGQGKGRSTLVLDEVDRSYVQLIRPPFVFNLQKRENGRLFPVNWLVRQWLLRTRCARLRQRYVDGDPRLHVESIELLHPDCRQLADSTEPFRVERVDIMQPIKGRYDLVRAMNVLNPGYFTTADIDRALGNIHTSLVIGGLFATGSNQDSQSPVNGAIYRKTARGFQRLLTSGSCSPVETRIEALVRP